MLEREKKWDQKINILKLIVLIIGIILFIYETNHYNFYEQKTKNNYVDISNTNNNADVEKEMTFRTTVKFIDIFILTLNVLIFIIGFYNKE